MTLTELTIENIYKYMVTNKINITQVEIKKNGIKPYIASGIDKEPLDKFNRFLSNQPTIENKLNLLVK